MAHYDLVTNLHACINTLESNLDSLRHLVTQQPLLIARVFSLPSIEKGHEHDGIERIPVTQNLGYIARDMALTHYSRLFMQNQSEKLSTKSAVRLPGAVCIKVDTKMSERIIQQVNEINALKEQLEHLITVKSGLSSEARFEFVHRHFRGLITLNAYRNVLLLTAPNSLRFGWANKHIIKNMTREAVIEQLERSLKASRAQGPWTREQWAKKIQQELETIRYLPATAKLKIKRPVKVQPIARVWNASKKKQIQHACPSPLLVLCHDYTQVPVLGKLLDYDADNVTHRHKPLATQLHLVIPRLYLWSDLPV